MQKAEYYGGLVTRAFPFPFTPGDIKKRGAGNEVFNWTLKVWLTVGLLMMGRATAQKHAINISDRIPTAQNKDENWNGDAGQLISKNHEGLKGGIFN